MQIDDEVTAAPPVTSRSRRTAVNAAVNFAAEVLGKGATFIWMVVATRVLAQEDFGALSYALALGVLVSALPGWGFDFAIVTRGSRNHRALERTYTETLVWQVGAALVVYGAAIGVEFSIRGATSTAVAFALVLVSTAVDLFSHTMREAAVARQRQAGMAGALVVQRSVTAAAVVGTLLSGGGLLLAAVAILTGSLVGLTMHFLALRRVGVRARPSSVSTAGLTELWRATLTTGVTGLVLVALFRIDSVLLQLFLGERAVAAYAVSYRLVETVLFVAWVLKDAVFPVMSADDDATTTRRGLQLSSAAAAAVYLPFAAGAAVLAPQVIGLLYGERYIDQSATILVLLAPAPMLFALAYFLMAALAARRLTSSMLISAGTALVVNVVLNLLLIPSLGGEGAAATTTVSYLVEVLVAWMLLRRRIGAVHLVRAIWVAASASAVMVVALVVVRLPVLPEIVLGAVVYALAYAVVARRWASEQLDLIATLIRRKM
ncbi:oligosaccharide flippase family protein [Klenkia sp. LSe6-5]|uniref:Oligosaccharide flippase family protein n=1 Tax=Klenkia sesuvii TaxID=3103137 RepID=A0ABU8DWY6_9ACTN